MILLFATEPDVVKKPEQFAPAFTVLLIILTF